MSYAKRIKKAASKFHEDDDNEVMSFGTKKKKQTQNRLLMPFKPGDVVCNESFERDGVRYHYELDDDEQIYLVRE